MEIDLSNYYENDCKFAENSKKFSLSKKINFIFGKNGTGKSTIKEAIRNKYGEEYNVCIFEGYE